MSILVTKAKEQIEKTIKDAIENAVKQVLKEGYRTIDIAKPGEPQVKCDEMGDLIAARV